MKLRRVKTWYALVVIIGSTIVGLTMAGFLPCSNVLTTRTTELKRVVAVRVAILTAPGHDQHHPTNIIASLAAALDRVVGTYAITPPTDNRSLAQMAHAVHTPPCGGSVQ